MTTREAAEAMENGTVVKFCDFPVLITDMSDDGAQVLIDDETTCVEGDGLYGWVSIADVTA